MGELTQVQLAHAVQIPTDTHPGGEMKGQSKKASVSLSLSPLFPRIFFHLRKNLPFALTFFGHFSLSRPVTFLPETEEARATYVSKWPKYS